MRSEHSHSLGMRVKELCLHFKVSWMPNIVGIKKGNQFSLGSQDECIAGLPCTGIRLPESCDSWFVKIEDPRRFIGAPIVHHQYFMRSVGLREHGIQRLSKRRATVIRWNKNTNLYGTSCLLHYRAAPG